MKNPVINPKLDAVINSLSIEPPHSIIIVGPKGAGKKTVANYLISNITQNDNNSIIFEISPPKDKKAIGIDQLRQVKKALKTKNESYRIILIKDAESMTSETQNSILKIVEEPPSGVVFIMTSSSPKRLYETIRSRSVSINYVKPTKKQLKEYADSLEVDEKDFNKFIKISQGRMGIFASLCQGDENHYLIQDINIAKDILSESANERLLRVDQYSKDQDATARLVNALVLVCEASLEASVGKDSNKKWLNRLKQVLKSSELLDKNVSTKLVLTKLFLVL